MTQGSRPAVWAGIVAVVGVFVGCGSPAGEKPGLDPRTDLLTARKGFQTVIKPNPAYKRDGPADRPPSGVFELVRYPSPAGKLAAYITPDPKDGKKRPGVVWARGGFGGISGGSFWSDPDPRNDQTASAFREAGFALLIPSWRGENDNPGRFELFYGEVEDLLAARDALARQTHVDPDRIYLAGHSTGGTMVLLAATATDKFRAAFSFGGAPDLYRVVGNGQGYGNTPFDHRNKDESYYRSATHFVGAIKRPTFYFEGCSDGYEGGYCPDADAMQRKAAKLGAPFRAFALPWGDHFTILHKTTRLVARKIAADTGPECTIEFTRDELKAR
jgi:dipeptidyl aminopeptidase/acylaminoacyl peptidase